MLGSFERYLKDKSYSHSIMTSHEFAGCRDKLQAKMKDLKKKGKGNLAEASDTLSNEEVEMCYASGAFGHDNPQSLIRTLWWIFCIHFGMRGAKEHYNLCWNDICLKKSSEGKRYLEHNERQTKMRSGTRGKHRTQVHAYELPGDPRRCPVRMYILYKSKCPEQAIGDEKPIYLQAKCYLNDMTMKNDQIWYKCQRYGYKSIVGFMPAVASLGGLSDDKKITNTSARKTMMDKMNKAGVPGHVQIQKSGHARVESLLNYAKLDEAQQEALSKVVGGETTYKDAFSHTSDSQMLALPPCTSATMLAPERKSLPPPASGEMLALPAAPLPGMTAGPVVGYTPGGSMAVTTEACKTVHTTGDSMSTSVHTTSMSARQSQFGSLFGGSNIYGGNFTINLYGNKSPVLNIQNDNRKKRCRIIDSDSD